VSSKPCHDKAQMNILLPYAAGVTSMSVDTHKFGMAHKGTSVVLYRSPDVRRHQFTQVRGNNSGGGLGVGYVLLLLLAAADSACKWLAHGLTHIACVKLVCMTTFRCSPSKPAATGAVRFAICCCMCAGH
jgi:hypothetical protein